MVEICTSIALKRMDPLRDCLNERSHNGFPNKAPSFLICDVAVSLSLATTRLMRWTKIPAIAPPPHNYSPIQVDLGIAGSIVGWRSEWDQIDQGLSNAHRMDHRS